MSRWISRDPAGERGGANLLGFVQNRPVQDFDAFGEESALSGVSAPVPPPPETKKPFKLRAPTSSVIGGGPLNCGAFRYERKWYVGDNGVHPRVKFGDKNAIVQEITMECEWDFCAGKTGVANPVKHHYWEAFRREGADYVPIIPDDPHRGTVSSDTWAAKDYGSCTCSKKQQKCRITGKAAYYNSYEVKSPAWSLAGDGPWLVLPHVDGHAPSDLPAEPDSNIVEAELEFEWSCCPGVHKTTTRGIKTK